MEMYEFLPSTLTLTQYNTIEDDSRKSKQRRELSVMEWVQSFGVYMAAVSRTKPHCIPDLLGYQQRIIQASCNRHPGCWADYDRQFRLKASATSSIEWSTIDLNIWNNAFPGITTNHGPSPVQPQPRSQYSTQRYASAQTRQPPSPQQCICLDWNDDPNPNCPHPNCKYNHVCYRCAYNPRITNNRHKAIFFPNKCKKSQYKPLIAQKRGQL